MTDTDQDNETSQREACDKGRETSPGFHKGKTPPCEKSREECPDAAIDGHDDDSSSSTTRDNALHDDYEALDAEDPQYPGGVPEPRGEPPKLTVQQRTRLHQLLRSGGLTDTLQLRGEATTSDEDLWRAFRTHQREEYRALRKRKRAEGSWDKDNHRGWNPSSSTREAFPSTTKEAIEEGDF